MDENTFIQKTVEVLQVKYKGGNFFPYPWQFDELPSDLTQKYWALEAISKYLGKSAVNQSLRDEWERELGHVSVQLVKKLLTEREGD